MTTYKFDLNSSHNNTKFFSKENNYLLKKTAEINSYINPERENFNINDERILQLKKLYDERVNSLYNNIKNIASKFEGDEILNTMRHDAISNDYISQRVKEIIDVNLTKEKEELFKKLSEELADARSKLAQKDHFINDLKTNHKATLEDYERKVQHLEGVISNETQNNKQLENKVKSLHFEVDNSEMQMRSNYEELQNKNNRLLGEFHKLKKEYDIAIDHIRKYDDIDKDNDSLKIEIERLKKVISVLEMECHNIEEKLKDRETKNENLHEEITIMKNQNFDGNLHIKKLIEENRSLLMIVDKYEHDRKSILEKYNNLTNEIEKNSNIKLSSIEQMFKDKNFLLKKKILEQKNMIRILNEDLGKERENIENLKMKERENTENLKMNNNMKIQQLKDDMLIIKNEWEKKCNQQDNYYEKVIADLEDKLKETEQLYENIISDNEVKKNSEIVELSNNYQSAIDEKEKEILKLNNETELLKKLEKDYIRISKHEEIMNFHLKELEQKHTDELNFKLEDLGNVYKNREDQRKSENDIEIDHLNNKIKQAEKHIEEMKNIISDLELKLKKEKDSHDKLIENYETIQKNYKFKTSQLEEDEKLINSLREKVYMLEENHNMLSNSKNSFQETIENLLNKIKNLESEKNAVKSNSAKNEEFYKEENENLEKVFRDYKESQTKKYNQIIEENSFKRNQIDTLEASSKKLQNYVISLEGKLRESTNQNEILQQIVNNLKLKIKNYEELLDELEKKKFYTEKNLKKTKYEKSNANDLLVKILKTKLNSMRDNISSMKSLMTNEINLVKNDMIRKTGELVSSQFTNLKQNFDKDLQKAREILQRENIKKLDDKDVYYSDEISKLTQKYDRKILDILRRNEILENEINKFKSEQYVYPTKISEIEKENSRLQNLISSLKEEKETLFNSMKQKKYEDLSNYAEKLIIQKEGSKKYFSVLSTILNSVTKLKAKYTEEIRKLRYDIDCLVGEHENERYNLVSTIQGLEKAICDERQEMAKTNKTFECREEEFLNISREVDKLKTMYESKVEILTNKINDLKSENKVRKQKLSESGNFINSNNYQIKALKSQIDQKTDEFDNFKRDFEQLLDLKTNKIIELQNQLKLKSTSTVKSTGKFDDEIMILTKKLNLNKVETPVNDR